MAEHRFTDPVARETMDIQELHSLLERLHAPCEVEQELRSMDADDTVTVAAVCEATGANPNEVIDLLADVRERVAEARMADALREMEAPTHRVERPGHAPKDGISSLPPLSRARLFSTILDDVVNERKPKVKFEKKQKPDFIATFILAFFGIVIILLGIAMAQQIFR